ncbi:hypothetical protein DMJ13_27360 [halophilic archaeon]|nr:hypothetical protein DMJ13_27360 [halophilic archaeon]
MPTGGSTGSAAAGGNSTNGNVTAGGSPSLNVDRWRSEFGTVINMAEAGADPTGERDVTPVIQDKIASDTLLYFPSGRYKMNSQVRRVSLRDVGILGENATLVHGSVTEIKGFDVYGGEFTGPAQHFKIGVPESPHEGKFLFGGFTLDWRAKNAGMQVLNHHTSGTSEVRGLRQVGMHSLGCQGPLRLHPATEDATIRARDLDFRFGGKTFQKTINDRDTRSLGGPRDRSLSTTGIAGHPQMQGRLRVENAQVGGWPDNGIYAIGGQPGEGDGTVEVVNCVTANSHPSNIRIGGDNSRIHKCGIVTDQSFDEDYYFEQRPIRLDDGTCSVTDTKIVQKVPTGWSITVQTGVEKARLRNIDVTIQGTPTMALVIDEGAGDVRVQNVSIRTPGWNASEAAVIRNGGATLQGVTLNGTKIA